MNEYRLRITESFTPASFPMARLAIYIAAFAKLLGGDGRLHFKAIEEGSTILAARVDDESAPAVAARCTALANGKADAAAVKAVNELDALLREDRAEGRLEGAEGGEIIAFPGRNRILPPDFGPVRKEGTLDGRLTRIGGRDRTSHAQLDDGNVVYGGLECTPGLAKEMARHLYGATLRIHGTGSWVRHIDGVWQLQKFRISRFEVLEDTDLRAAVDELRHIKGSLWGEVDDPVRALMEERHGTGGRH